MLGPLARTTAVMPLAVIQIACSVSHELAGDDRYAHCTDLGELALQSYSRADAERRMRVRVLELGGDLLLFGERGRSGRLSDSPEEIVERRNVLLATAAADGGERPAVAITAEHTDDPDAPAADQASAEQKRTGVITAEKIEDPQGELWFYGAALRCTPADPFQ